MLMLNGQHDLAKFSDFAFSQVIKKILPSSGVQLQTKETHSVFFAVKSRL